MKLQLVRDLVKSIKNNRSVFIKKRNAELKSSKQKAAIVAVLDQAVIANNSIWSAK